MNDIIYFGYSYDDNALLEQTKFINHIKREFVDVIITDGYDDKKGYRQYIQLHDIQTDKYYVWLLKNRWAEKSLTMQMIRLSEHFRFNRLCNLANRETYKYEYNSQ